MLNVEPALSPPFPFFNLTLKLKAPLCVPKGMKALQHQAHQNNKLRDPQVGDKEGR